MKDLVHTHDSKKGCAIELLCLSAFQLVKIEPLVNHEENCIGLLVRGIHLLRLTISMPHGQLDPFVEHVRRPRRWVVENEAMIEEGFG